MFTRSDVSMLLAADPPLAVSIFLPTHIRGAEVRQDPIRLSNLTTAAKGQLSAHGLSAPELEAFLAPAAALVDDYRFWQHQGQGLALFLDQKTGARRYHVPISLDERVIVGPGFHIRPLLPILTADGSFIVLTLTLDKVRLYHASRFALEQDESALVTGSLQDVPFEPDYQNPVQAPPVARPHTGTINISNAQVYGDAPPERRKTQLAKFAQHVASDVESVLAGSVTPVVLVADTELGGRFRQATSLGPRLVGTAEVNPAALDDTALHAAAYPLVQPVLDAARSEAVERVAALLGQADQRLALDVGDVVRAAHQGRVDKLLLNTDATLWGCYNADNGELVLDDSYAATGQDLLEAAAAHTLRTSGTVHVLPGQDMPRSLPLAAVLRY